MSKKNEF